MPPEALRRTEPRFSERLVQGRKARGNFGDRRDGIAEDGPKGVSSPRVGGVFEGKRFSNREIGVGDGPACRRRRRGTRAENCLVGLMQPGVFGSNFLET